MHCADTSHWRAQLSDVLALIISGHIERLACKAIDNLLPSVIEANLGVSLGVAIAHRFPLTRHLPKPTHLPTVKQYH